MGGTQNGRGVRKTSSIEILKGFPPFLCATSIFLKPTVQMALFSGALHHLNISQELLVISQMNRSATVTRYLFLTSMVCPLSEHTPKTNLPGVPFLLPLNILRKKSCPQDWRRNSTSNHATTTTYMHIQSIT